MTQWARLAIGCAVIMILCAPAAARKGGGMREDGGHDRDNGVGTWTDSNAAPQQTVAPGPAGGSPTIPIATAPMIIVTPREGKHGGKVSPTPLPAIIVKPGKVDDEPDDRSRSGKSDPKPGRKKDDQNREADMPVPFPEAVEAPDSSTPAAAPHTEPITLVAPGGPQSASEIPTRRAIRAGAHKHPKQDHTLGTPLAAPTMFIPHGTPPTGHAISSGPINPLLPHAIPGSFGANAPHRKPGKAAPTPGPTPVPTPATVTPTPANFHPGKHWKPPAGWTPPPGWKPPKGWVPPGGWIAPPGWRPTKGWTLKLFHWGWCYVPKRGWVVPPRWIPPPTFITPPGWYYLPQDEYVTYQVSDPAIIEIVPGVARTELIQPIDQSESYTPSDEVSQEISDSDMEEESEESDVIERPMPEQPPAFDSRSDIEQIIRELSRGRDPENRYAGPVVATQLVQFEDDAYAILPQSFAFLDALGEALLDPSLEDAVVSIEAHTNGTIADEDARVLTERRAWAVKGYLVQKFGIDPNRIRYSGYGNDAPIAPHDSDDGFAMNERLEIENITDLFGDESASEEPGAVPTEDDGTTTAEPAAVASPAIKFEFADRSTTGTLSQDAVTSDILTSSTIAADLPTSGVAAQDRLTTVTISFP